jgi:S-adenosylmethionine hydrolase
VRVIGVNAGYALSFVRNEAEKLRWASAAAEGSQFRSRDLFPQAAAAIALGRPQALAEDIPHKDIPDVPPNRVAYVDGYGNLKTTIRFKPNRFSPGSTLDVQINGIEQKATVSDGTFAVEHGRMAFAPGSSGWKSNSEEIRWIELFLRGGNASEAFRRPAINSEISIRQAG